MQSNDLALPLDHEELFHITSICLINTIYLLLRLSTGQLDLYSTGMIPVIQAGSILPWLLSEILVQRMELQLVSDSLFILSILICDFFTNSNTMDIMLKKNGYNYHLQIWGTCTCKKQQD